LKDPSEFRTTPFHDLDECEVRDLFADQARTAQEMANEFEPDRPRWRIRGPEWLVVPIVTAAVATLPFWFVPALYLFRAGTFLAFACLLMLDKTTSALEKAGWLIVLALFALSVLVPQGWPAKVFAVLAVMLLLPLAFRRLRRLWRGA